MYTVNNSHPYGITPDGNRFFHSKSIRFPGLYVISPILSFLLLNIPYIPFLPFFLNRGKMAQFNDQIILDILSYATGCDLARFSQISLAV